MFHVELLLTVLSTILCVINCYPSGAPSSSCINLLPNHHGTASQPLPAPYIISANRDTYSPRTPLIISVFGRPAFMAFLIQGQIKDTGEPAGQFVRLPANTKYLRCSNEQDSVTHSNPTPRNISQFVWNPPLEDVGEIIFKGSVARTKSFYYGGIESVPIKYVAASSGGMLPGGDNYSGVYGNRAGALSKPASSILMVYLCITCLLTTLVNFSNIVL